MSLRIGITIGDPAGIGPEIVVRAVRQMAKLPVRWVIFGPESVKNDPYIQSLGPFPDSVEWVVTGSIAENYVKGKADCDNGKAVEVMLKVANEWAMSSKIDALVTAPISKTSLHLAGSRFTGHTTMLQSLSNSAHVSMAFYSPQLKTVLTTIHHPYIEVPSLLTPERLKTTIRHAFLYAKMLRIATPKIAIAGLNPHAGEDGLFGDEESRLLAAPIAEMANSGYPVIGPLSPDTVFRRAFDGEFDIVIALYHDQGLIPIKLLAFDSSVNVSVGLPYIRVSPDHGTAFDIAYQGKASENSLMAAIQLATTLHAA